MRGSLFVPSPLLSSAGLVLALFEREFSPLGSALAVSTASLCFLSSPRGCFRELQPHLIRVPGNVNSWGERERPCNYR